MRASMPHRPGILPEVPLRYRPIGIHVREKNKQTKKQQNKTKTKTVPAKKTNNKQTKNVKGGLFSVRHVKRV